MGSSVGIVTRLQAWRSGARISKMPKYSCLVQNLLFGSGADPASCWMTTGVYSRRQIGQGVLSTTHLHLRMSGVIPLLPLYAFMAYTKDNITFAFIKEILWCREAWTGLIWLRIGTDGGFLWMRWWTVKFHKEILRSASQEGICSIS